MGRQVVVTQTESWYIDREFYPGHPFQRDEAETVIQTIWEPVELYFDDDEDTDDVLNQYILERHA
ncbi:MAG: hypothetical protein IJR00_03210 [Lachnospiraceae bacterium]|nr:hypothetical protein [Lachnospiraceae bacterium]